MSTLSKQNTVCVIDEVFEIKPPEPKSTSDDYSNDQSLPIDGPGALTLTVLAIACVIVSMVLVFTRQEAHQQPTPEPKHNGYELVTTSSSGERHCINISGSDTDPKVVTVANCGDAQVLLVFGRKNMFLSTPRTKYAVKIKRNWERFQTKVYDSEMHLMGNISLG